VRGAFHAFLLKDNELPKVGELLYDVLNEERLSLELYKEDYDSSLSFGVIGNIF
jgi:hypothetical protein